MLEKTILDCKADSISFSGGLDSSIIAYFLKDLKPKMYTIIAKDFLAADLTYCQLFTKELNLPLEIKTVETNEILSAVEETIKILRHFNDIEIRNSVVMYLALSKIKENGHTSVITGDGADELFAGYSFLLRKTENELEKDLERIRKIMHFPTNELGKNIGIEIESPFLNEGIVEFAKKLPNDLKIKTENGKKYGKWILRKAFEGKIPESILWRDKSPMQDGSGTAGLTSLFDAIIQDSTFDEKKKRIEKEDKVILRTKESMFYYETYRKYCDPPIKLHDSPTRCPYCQGDVKETTQFCKMCGSFPI